jgi:hypothetical protein
MQPVELAVAGRARAASRDDMTYSACDHLRGPCEFGLFRSLQNIVTRLKLARGRL